MERQGRASSKTPLLENNCEKGTVKHPFPMNYFLKPWKLGQWFYQVIKIGIVQYVCFVSWCWLLFLASFSCYPFSSSFTLTGKQIIYTVLQMIIKSLSAILAVILEAFSLYCEGDFKWGCG